MVDEDFARRYWPRGGAIGQRVFEGSEQRNDADAFTIVGVAGPVKQAGLIEDEAQGAVYYQRADRGVPHEMEKQLNSLSSARAALSPTCF